MTNILIVDDDDMARSLLCEVLAAPGRTLVPAVSASEALSEAAAMPSLALAVVDKNLPDKSGIDLVRELKAKHPDAAYIMVTAYPTVDSATEAIRLGFDDYIGKPFDIDALEAAVGRALARVSEVSHDRERRRAVEDRLIRFTLHDQLTGLFNRSAFLERLETSLAHARSNPAHPVTVLVIDLDEFGRINDSIGNIAGDQVLVEWAARLSRLLRAGDTLARLDGDELTILAEGASNGAAVEIAERVAHAVSKPFNVSEREVTLTASIGIAVSSPRYERGQDLLRDASTALVHAKTQGRGGYAIFRDEMRSRAVDRFSLHQELRRAVEHSEFVAYFQPIIAVESRRVVGFESLARWVDPARGVLPPSQFLGLAVETGLLAEVSWQVLQKACKQQRVWLDRFGSARLLPVNINVAPPLLGRPGFVSALEAVLKELSLSPSHIKVEVTETVAMADSAASAEIIQALRRLGIVVCLDDFGTGYASLSWLHQFPVDEIKIDRTFVAGAANDRRSQILVGAAVGLAHNLGLPVVAEGVETEEQLAELRTIACEYAQGFLFARPLPADQAEALIEREIRNGTSSDTDMDTGTGTATGAGQK